MYLCLEHWCYSEFGQMVQSPETTRLLWRCEPLGKLKHLQYYSIEGIQRPGTNYICPDFGTVWPNAYVLPDPTLISTWLKPGNYDALADASIGPDCDPNENARHLLYFTFLITGAYISYPMALGVPATIYPIATSTFSSKSHRVRQLTSVHLLIVFAVNGGGNCTGYRQTKSHDRSSQ